MSARENIVVKKARVHNLKNIDLEIPKHKLVVFTGLSGSGKSSLLFNTLFEEGRARYLRAMLPEVFRRLQFDSPDVDYISGLLPPIALEQRTWLNRNPRSTLGTSTGCSALLRALYAKLGDRRAFAGEDIRPSMLSFNAHGMCPRCRGLGKIMAFDKDLVIPDPNITIEKMLATAIRQTFHCLDKPMAALAAHLRFRMDVPFRTLEKQIQRIILYGYHDEINVDYASKKSFTRRRVQYPGILPFLERSYKETSSQERAQHLESYMSSSICPDCRGTRLNPRALSVTIKGKNIADIVAMTVAETAEYFRGYRLNAKIQPVADKLLKELQIRLRALSNVGLGYLTLERPLLSLSLGELQRSSLGYHLGSQLGGLMYLLDEPTVGLHDKEKASLVQALLDLRQLGNSVLVIEHDELVIRSADHIVELGPGPGQYGGRIVVQGSPRQVMQCKTSSTGQYLRKGLAFRASRKRVSADTKWITVLEAAENNLANITVSIPCQMLVCVSGLSGSGKSTLVQDVLYPALLSKLQGKRVPAGKHKAIKGAEHIDRIVDIDQAPIGRTIRSNPASYIGAWDLIRKLFADLPEARQRGLRPANFSFNTPEGQCPECKGGGAVPISTYLLSDVYTSCDTCKGTRFNQNVLAVKHNKLSAADILALTFEEARGVFEQHKPIRRFMDTMCRVGLGYIRLGQPSATLSAGEAQRVKLASELHRNDTGKTLYVLDEPTTGLHPVDVQRLMAILSDLVDSGNTVLIVEHNLDVLGNADYIIDLGPESGPHGGRVVACGTPEVVAACRDSHTGHCLAPYLKRKGSPLDR